MRNIYPQEKQKNRIPVEEFKQSSTKETENTLCNPRRYSCFRCGTKSLVEIQFRRLNVDVCSNESCGCIHLDPGELEILLLGERGFLHKVRRSSMGETTVPEAGTTSANSSTG